MTEKNLNEPAIPNGYGILFKNSFYSFMNTYGTFIFSLVSSFLLARLIDDINWGYFTLAISYIQIISLLLNFLPPSLKNTLHYFIPRLASLGKKNELKALIRRSIILKVVFLVPAFFLSLILFIFFSELFLLNLTENTVSILIILSPLIIINNLQVILNSINMGFNRFKSVFILVAIQYSVYICFLLYYFLYLKIINLETLCLIYVISALIPFILNILINSIHIHNIKTTGKSSSSLKEDFREIFRYGALVRTATFFSDIWGEIQVQSIGVFESPNMVLGFKISRDLLSISTNTSLAVSYPLTISFSSFIAKEEKKNIIAIYNLLLKYLIFLAVLITGILFFSTDLFIVLVYGEPRLIYSDIVKIYLFTFIFLILASPFDALLLAENRVKYMILIRIAGLIIRLPIFLFLIVFFNLYQAFFGIIISNFLFSVLYLVITVRVGKIQLNIKKISCQFLVFFLSLAVTIVFEYLFLNDLNSAIFGTVPILKHFDFLSLLCFLLLFIIFVILFKILTVSDVEKLQTFFFSEKKLHQFTNKSLNLIKKILRN